MMTPPSHETPGNTLPAVVERLLARGREASRESDWSAFLEEYSRLLLHVARSLGGSYDAAMDRYAYVLDQLRQDDFRRLRGYAADGRGKFTTWLVVVARRLCYDQGRLRYGRPRGGDPEVYRQRRELAELVGAEVELDGIASAEAGPEQELRALELYDELNRVLALLDPSDRLLLRLRLQDEVAVAEIARLLAFPSVFHVYRRLNRVLAQLRSSLVELGVTDATP
jgi:RNA polymerase sigma factor (sigma-70 family)